MGPEEEFELFDSENSWHSVFQVGSDVFFQPTTDGSCEISSVLVSYLLECR